MQRIQQFTNPLTIFLVLAAAYLTMGQVLQVAAPKAAQAQAGQGARITELGWAAAHGGAEQSPDGRGNLLGRLGEKLFLDSDAQEVSSDAPKNPWDAAIEAVLLAEGGKLEEAAKRLEGAPGGAFRACWEAAYGSGPIPPDGDVDFVAGGLSNGLASKLLDASIATKRGGRDGGFSKADILAEYTRKAAVLTVIVLALSVAALVGLGIAAWMLAKRPPLADPPHFQMSAAHALNVCLGWYVCFFLSSTVVGFIASAANLGAWALPLNYSLHAVCGIAFICIAEKISPLAMWRRMSKLNWNWPARGAQFLLLAVALTLAASWLLSFVMPDGDQPQKELVELVSGSKGVFPILAVFGTVALLGPIFEEVFFRGFLLSLLRRRMPVVGALLLSSVLFGLIHFDLQTIPLLAVLGCALGLAFMGTGDIKTAILVHGCWNGGVFLFQRLVVG